MFLLDRVILTHFKNHGFVDFQFNNRIIGIAGSNGAGKTNLLDAIYYLCFTKSYFGRSDAQQVQHGQSGFRIEGDFVLNDKHFKAVCVLRENGKKEFSVNGEPYARFANHVGRFPCIMIAPDDVEIITGLSEMRRRFADGLICQLDQQYLQSLIDYNRVLQQRNSLLKQLAEHTSKDNGLLDVYDAQLVTYGQYVFNTRKAFFQQLLPRVENMYQQIAGEEDHISLAFRSQLLDASFSQLLAQNRNRDILLQRTHAGIHRDDISILFAGQPFKQVASQGQRKSLLFAMKLAEYEILKEQKGFAPLLLLDDVFEKLDAGRMNNLLHRVCIENDGQVFITDTHESRIRHEMESLGAPFGLVFPGSSKT